MPIYEFVCGECGYEFEKILSFSATTTPVCVNCGTDNVARQMGRPAIHFKGSGWYVNDSKKGNGKNGNSNPASSSPNDSGTEGEKVPGATADNSPSDNKTAGSETKEPKPASTKASAASAKTEAA